MAKRCRSCCGGNSTLTVNGCGGFALAGAGVAITLSGSSVFTGNTDSAGKVKPNLSPSTTYTLVVTSDRFTTLTTTWVTGTTGPFTKTVSPAATSSYLCTSLCAMPFPTTLHLTCGGTAYTLTRTGGGSGWSGCQMFNCGDVVANPAYPNTDPNQWIKGSGNVAIGLALGLASIQVFTTFGCNPPPCGANCVGGFAVIPRITCTPGTNSVFNASNVLTLPVTLGSCPPGLSMTFTMPASTSSSCAGFPSGSTPFTLSWPFSGLGTITE